MISPTNHIWTILPIFLTVLSLSQFAKAKCVDRSSNFDECLQCCTDTARLSMVIKNDPNIVNYIAVLCSGGAKPEDEGKKPQAKAAVKKYKLNYYEVESLCGGPNPGYSEIETFQSCPDTCKQKHYDKGKDSK